MEAPLGENAFLYTMVKKWTGEFKHGRESLEDDLALSRTRRPVTITTHDTNDKILDKKPQTGYVTGKKMIIASDFWYSSIE